MGDDEFLTIEFLPPALEEWAKAYPDFPPGDEMALKIRLLPCSECGEEIPEGEVGGIDPSGITKDGELVGRFICATCMKEGL